MLASQTRDVGFELLDLIEEIDEPLTLDRRLERTDPVFELSLQLREPPIDVGDSSTRFVVVEECRVREGRGEQRTRRDNRKPQRLAAPITPREVKAISQHAHHSPA